MLMREMGDTLGAYELLSETRNKLPNINNQVSAFARMTAVLIYVLFERGDFAAASRVAQEAIADLDDQSPPQARAQLLWNASLVAGNSGDPMGAVLMSEEALALMQLVGHQRSITRLRLNVAFLQTRLTPPDLNSALAQLRAAEQELGDTGPITDRAAQQSELARVLIMQGEVKAAKAAIENAIALRKDIDADGELAQCILLSAQIAAADGRSPEVPALIAHARQLLANATPSRATSLVWRELGDALITAGQLEDGSLCLQLALDDAGIRATETLTLTKTKPKRR